MMVIDRPTGRRPAGRPTPASSRLGEQWERWWQAANRPVPINPLIALRVAFGLLMFVSSIRFMASGWIRQFYVEPVFHFTYWGFAWVKPLPEPALWAIFLLQALAALLIAAGLLYRLSMVSFFLLFTYIELLDKAYYLNHYYLILVLSFLLIFLPLNGAWSLDVRWRLRPAQPFVPAGLLWLVRTQLGLVYFYAGVAKLNADWLLAAQPLAIWLRARTAVPLIGPWLDYRPVAYLMSWAGLLFDPTVPFWLSWSRSRAWAYLAVVAFHLLTGLLFPIGMFPYIMIGLTLVFFPWRQQGPGPSQAGSITPFPRPVTILLGTVLALQLLLPWRHLLYPGPVNWTGEGFRFAWRVMLVEKAGQAVFTVLTPETGRTQLILPADYLTLVQEQQMSYQPDMIQQFAHFLEAESGTDVVVTAEVSVSWNGRGSQLLIDPAVDLTAQPDTLAHRPWIRDPEGSANPTGWLTRRVGG